MKPVSLVLGLLVLAGGCSRPAPPVAPADDALAVVDGERISAAQFQAESARRGVGPDPAARRALLDEMIGLRAALQEAHKRGLDRDPETVAAWEALLAGKVREAERPRVDAEMAVTPADAEAEYRAHPEAYSVPSRVRAALIFVEAPATFTPAKRAERRAAIDEARTQALTLGPETAGFGALSARVSFDQATKYRGGDLGYLVDGAQVEGIEAPVVAAAFALARPGDVSEILETPRGFSLVRLTERQPGGVRPFESVRGAIVARLTRQRAAEAGRRVEAALLAGRKVEVRPDRLAALPAPSALAVRSVGSPAPAPPSVPEN